MTGNTKYGFKTMHLFCRECDTELGYVIYRRWIDFEFCLCNLCMEKRLQKGTYADETEKQGEKP